MYDPDNQEDMIELFEQMMNRVEKDVQDEHGVSLANLDPEQYRMLDDYLDLRSVSMEVPARMIRTIQAMIVLSNEYLELLVSDDSEARIDKTDNPMLFIMARIVFASRKGIKDLHAQCNRQARMIIVEELDALKNGTLASKIATMRNAVPFIPTMPDMDTTTTEE